MVVFNNSNSNKYFNLKCFIHNFFLFFANIQSSNVLLKSKVFNISTLFQKYTNYYY